ncbi:MAG TPA: hypothetical protein VIF57_07355 [Polyangia bacterium]|jgi:uncharacterized membrane protein YgcG
MHMRLTTTMVTLGAGCALAMTAGCSSSQPSSGLWSCFDTGTQTACTQVSALSTADRDVNGDGIPDHFVCADDDDDGHNRDRDRDQSGLTSLTAVSGHDADHDGVDDDLDCDGRHECESLSNDANPERHMGEVEIEHDGGVEDHDGGHRGGDSSGSGSGGGGGSSGGGGVEMHDDHTCTAPKLTP